MQSNKQVALVTGGRQGIGRGIVERLLCDGMQVMSCGRTERPAGFPEQAGWCRADVAKPHDVANLLAATESTFGTVTVLVNNAGVQVEKTTLDSSDADWDLVVGVNCRGVFNMCRAVLPGMLQSHGSIINIGSISGTVSDAQMALYNASKAFVDGLTRSIAIDHGPEIRCNTIKPGWVMTDMAEDAFALARDPAAAMRDARARHAVGRFGQPQDIANMVSWLASSEASYVSGQCFTIDGGLTAASPLQPAMF